MSDTPLLSLPLVEPSQAQKHVTVNEALLRIDALTQLSLLDTALATPPSSPVEGDCYAVPVGATNHWAGQDGQVAVFSNGGWVFLSPRAGWRAWLADAGAPGTFDGVDWIAGTGALSPNGAAMTARVIEIDHVIGAGPTSDTVDIIPAQSVVYGVTGRVLSALTGTAGAWRLGIGGVSDDRYGSGLGMGQGSWVRGITSSPLAYYGDTPLTLTGEGGDLASGTVRLAVHVVELALPRG